MKNFMMRKAWNAKDDDGPWDVVEVKKSGRVAEDVRLCTIRVKADAERVTARLNALAEENEE